jgi:hypothetical protein
MQAVLPKVFNKLNDDVCLVHLLVDRLADVLTFSLNEFVLRQFLVQVLGHLVDRCDNHVCVQVQESSVVAHLLSLLPVEKDFPQTDGVLVNLLEILKVVGTRQLVLCHLLLRVLVILVQKLQELSVKDDLGPNLMDSLGPLKELL